MPEGWLGKCFTSAGMQFKYEYPAHVAELIPAWGPSPGGTEVRVRPEVRVVEAEAGPGTRILPGLEAPSERAQDFARRQMYGGGVRRAPAGRGISNHMVVQPRELAKRGPASNFVKS